MGHDKVVFKTILTTAERERVDTAQMQFIKTNDGKEFSVTDTAKVTLANKHELLKTSIVSINGDNANCFERLQKMFEVDGEFVYKALLEEQKKTRNLTTTQ